jgi:hypothetical protein
MVLRAQRIAASPQAGDKARLFFGARSARVNSCPDTKAKTKTERPHPKKQGTGNRERGTRIREHPHPSNTGSDGAPGFVGAPADVVFWDISDAASIRRLWTEALRRTKKRERPTQEASAPSIQRFRSAVVPTCCQSRQQRGIPLQWRLKFLTFAVVSMSGFARGKR